MTHDDTDDPFAPEADPYAPVPLALTRRTTLTVLASAPLATLLSGCLAPRRLACDPDPVRAHACRHRFCRFYGGPASA